MQEIRSTKSSTAARGTARANDSCSYLPKRLAAVNHRLLRGLAVATINTDATRYQLGCVVVRALEPIQDTACLQKTRQNLRTEITRAEGGFNHRRHTLFNQYLTSLSEERGTLSTGVTEPRSINNLSVREMVDLGETFSWRPSTLDGTVSDWWDNSGMELGTSDSMFPL